MYVAERTNGIYYEMDVGCKTKDGLWMTPRFLAWNVGVILLRLERLQQE